MRIILYDTCKPLTLQVRRNPIIINITTNAHTVGRKSSLNKWGIAFQMSRFWADSWKTRRNKAGKSRSLIQGRGKSTCILGGCGCWWQVVLFSSSKVKVTCGNLYESRWRPEWAQGLLCLCLLSSFCTSWVEATTVISWPNNQEYFHLEKK